MSDYDRTAEVECVQLELRHEDTQNRAVHSTARSLPKVGSLIALEREHIAEVLRGENGNDSKAARTFGVERQKLYRMMKQDGIEG
ncbi:hypothetical protein Q31b_19480 [Novipirellula aureliae]|uniref:DNA binding HTH domain-containing protein n=1 Tax=Novipirellula aureliae TaxID=2527966 RepID=A0A5C6E659_9BACT|nr:helix-turn-helix domain-containing protein [Novipirellula aureliae]TWU44412.1 hypothetical protein Q31b_19480 [Novipirellula aureliae]